jgi:hypothetical protein
MNYLGAGSTLTNIAVLLEPSNIIESKKEQTIKYLEKYAEEMFKVRTYWNDASHFSAELRQRWDKFKV